ncbi:hypothetical protein [Actinomadura chokoriensis]|uniref:ATP-binding protein n=1 Tax=Actinomadura chokoriensis TaxID=454156 RepID=A0ABV4QT82_9ACTN
MKFSARSLLGVAVAAPFAAAFAVAAAPADAAPGPTTALLYDTAATADPVTRALPAPVVRTGGQTAERATGTADGALRSAPDTSGLLSGAARCKLNPGKTLNTHAGTKLPETPLNTVDRTPLGRNPLGGLPKGDCLKTRRAAASDRAAASERASGTDASSVLPVGRGADMPVSMALPSVPSALGTVRRSGLPLGTALPAGARHATPVPSGDILGQASGTVSKVGVPLGGSKKGAGQLVNVLKAKNRTARPADGPLSMPDASALGLPAVPGIG